MMYNPPKGKDMKKPFDNLENSDAKKSFSSTENSVKPFAKDTNRTRRSMKKPAGKK